MSHIELTNLELTALMAQDPSVVVVDVRTPHEFTGLGHIAGATLLPLQKLQERVNELDPKSKIVLICQHGVRSMNATLWLEQQGFTRLYNLTHGMSEWDGPTIK